MCQSIQSFCEISILSQLLLVSMETGQNALLLHEFPSINANLQAIYFDGARNVGSNGFFKSC